MRVFISAIQFQHTYICCLFYSWRSLFIIVANALIVLLCLQVSATVRRFFPGWVDLKTVRRFLPGWVDLKTVRRFLPGWVDLKTVRRFLPEWVDLKMVRRFLPGWVDLKTVRLFLPDGWVWKRNVETTFLVATLVWMPPLI